METSILKKIIGKFPKNYYDAFYKKGNTYVPSQLSMYYYSLYTIFINVATRICPSIFTEISNGKYGCKFMSTSNEFPNEFKTLEDKQVLIKKISDNLKNDSLFQSDKTNELKNNSNFISQLSDILSYIKKNLEIGNDLYDFALHKEFCIAHRWSITDRNTISKFANNSVIIPTENNNININIGDFIKMCVENVNNAINKHNLNKNETLFQIRHINKKYQDKTDHRYETS